MIFFQLEEKSEPSKVELKDCLNSLELKLEFEHQKQEITNKENHEMRETLKKLVHSKMPALDDIVTRVKSEELERFEKEKNVIVKDLQNRIEKVNIK